MKKTIVITLVIILIGVYLRIKPSIETGIPVGDDFYYHTGIAQFLCVNKAFPKYICDVQLGDFDIVPVMYAPFFRVLTCILKTLGLSWYSQSFLLIILFYLVAIIGYIKFFNYLTNNSYIALLSAFYISISPINIFRTNVLTPELISLTIIPFALLYFLKLLNENNKKYLICAGILSGVLVLLSPVNIYYFLVTIMGISLYKMLSEGINTKELFKKGSIIFIIMALFYLPWFIFLKIRFGSEFIYTDALLARPLNINYQPFAIFLFPIFKKILPCYDIFLHLSIIVGLYFLIKNKLKKIKFSLFVYIFLIFYSNLSIIGIILKKIINSAIIHLIFNYSNPEPYRANLIIVIFGAILYSTLIYEFFRKEMGYYYKVAGVLLILIPMLTVFSYYPRIASQEEEYVYDSNKVLVDANVPPKSKVCSFVSTPYNNASIVDSDNPAIFSEILNGQNIYENLKKLNADYITVRKDEVEGINWIDIFKKISASDRFEFKEEYKGWYLYRVKGG